jgi:predicted TIM-barrel fold metal-dependent hydrolase
MFIYNVTVSIDKDVHDEWLQWMREKHIPDVMSTGCFKENRLVKVLNTPDEGITYSFQYTFEEMAHYEKYQNEHAKKMQADVKQKYDNKFVAFRTILEIID